MRLGHSPFADADSPHFPMVGGIYSHFQDCVWSWLGLHRRMLLDFSEWGTTHTLALFSHRRHWLSQMPLAIFCQLNSKHTELELLVDLVPTIPYTPSSPLGDGKIRPSGDHDTMLHGSMNEETSEGTLPASTIMYYLHLSLPDLCFFLTLHGHVCPMFWLRRDPPCTQRWTFRSSTNQEITEYLLCGRQYRVGKGTNLSLSCLSLGFHRQDLVCFNLPSSTCRDTWY